MMILQIKYNYLKSARSGLFGMMNNCKMVSFYDTYSAPNFAALLNSLKLPKAFVPFQMAQLENEFVPFEMVQIGKYEIMPIQSAQIGKDEIVPIESAQMPKILDLIN